jgi:non-specific serine/threonine protein kinase
MAIWSAEIKELEKLCESIKGQLPDLEKEMDQLIRTDDANVIMLYSRRCLEVIIIDLLECELKRPRKTEPLKGIIDKLHKEEKVPSHIISSMYSLNELSTYGTHPKDFDPEQVKPVLINLDIIIKWYLKYKGFRIVDKTKAEDEKNESKFPTVSTLEKSIIVLPFENISPDPEQEYFSDGLTEEIITDLSHIHDLLVISRSSAMTFKGIKKKIGEIAKEVNVRYVLEGSVRKAGNNIRITAQLIDGLNDSHIWAEKYIGTMDDIFDIQEKVSRSIAASLKLKLSSDEDRNISQRLIIDIQAYEYYLKAKKEINNWSEPGMERALEYLQKGLEITGDNVLFYFGMGYVYFNYINTGLKNKEECIIKTEQYVKKIFDLDPDSVFGHRLLGILNIRQSHVQQGVIQLKKTLAIDPNDLDALNWLIIAYCNNGKPHAALPLAERIINIDPSSYFGPFWSAYVDLLNGNFRDALKKSYEAYKMAPNAPNVKIAYAWILAYNNKMEECYSVCDENFRNNPESIFALMGQCLKYALQGEREKTIKAMSDGVKDKARTNLWDASFIAACDALIGEKDEAITSLEYSVNLGALNYPFYFEIDPFLENIREEERFKKLMERVKIEWENFEV